MIEFKQYMKHSQGTYSCLNLSQESKDQLFEFVSKYIQSPTDKEDYHCTITYSKRPCPEIESYQPKLPIIATAKSYQLFNDQYFVLLLESLDLHHLHQANKNLGAIYDYPIYQPHITISTNYKNETYPPVPDFKLVFDSYKIEPLED